MATAKKPRLTREVYCDAEGTYRWRLVDQNMHILADSGEGYSKRSECKRMFGRIATACKLWRLNPAAGIRTVDLT